MDKSLTNNREDKKQTNIYDYNYLNENEVNKLLENFENSKRVSSLSPEEFKNYLEANSLRFFKNLQCDSKDIFLDTIEDLLINSICSPNVIQAIKNEFFKRYQKEDIKEGK